MTLAGCPLLSGPEFTSADVNPGRGFFGGLPGAANGDALEEDGGGAVPRDVVEPDVIRRDGNLLYVLNQFRGLSIIDLDTTPS